MQTSTLCISVLIMKQINENRRRLVEQLCYAAAHPVRALVRLRREKRVTRLPTAAKRINNAESERPMRAFGG